MSHASSILGQQRLDQDDGILVKLSTENQLFLSVKKPSRVRIPATLLEHRVEGFRAGVHTFLKVRYEEKNATCYHQYVGGDVWVPTVPKEVAKPREVLTIKVAPLTLQDFLSCYPRLKLKNERSRAWMADEAEVGVRASGGTLSLEITQAPAIEGLSQQLIQGTLNGGLVFQTGSIISNFGVVDAFGKTRRLRLYHNGYTRAWPGVEVAGDFFPVYHVTVDKFRLRLAYSYPNGFATTTLYVQPPSPLYSLGESTLIPNRWSLKGISEVTLVRDVRPTRELERLILKHGNNYEVGRLGAEIAYTILNQKFRCENLIINEPAKGGKDLNSSDKSVIAQARLLVHYEPQWLEWFITKELKQMTRKLRIDFGHTKEAKIGYAALSFFEGGEVKSFVLEIQPTARNGRERALTAI